VFGRHFFGGRYFGGRFFGDGGDIPAGGASAAQVWAYVLSNGKTAGENLVEVNEGIAALLAMPHCLETPIAGIFTAADVLRILAAVAAGTSSIQALGGGAARVTFDGIDGTADMVDADMQGSERTSVTIDPGETPS
jgi:hypothetical protein